MNPEFFFGGGGGDDGNCLSPRRKLQGPRPSALKVNKDSNKITKPPVAPPQLLEHREPVIIYPVSPRVIHADATDFKKLVQHLTGKPTDGGASSSSDFAGSLSPAARVASIEQTSPCKDREITGADNNYDESNSFLGDFLGDTEVEMGRVPGILSPAPANLPPISPGFFSPSLDPFMIPSPSTLFSVPMRANVPKFGNWVDADNVPYTVYFDKARKNKGGKMINPNDPQENPDMFPDADPSPVDTAPLTRPRLRPEETNRRAAVEPTPERRASKELNITQPARSSRPCGGSEQSIAQPARSSRPCGGSEQSIDRSPVHPHYQARVMGRASGSPSWEGKNHDSSHAPHGTPGRSWHKPASRGDESWVLKLIRKKFLMCISTADSDSASVPETDMPRNMPTYVSDFKSLQTVESESSGEIQVVHERMTLTGAEKLHIEERDITAESVLKERHYLINVKEDHIELKLDHQTILIEDIRSSTQPECSRVLNLIEQNLRELPEKSNYRDSFVLFAQRNHQLTVIHSSFFDSMPNLRFLDLSDTRIRILPSSLYRLLKLKVLILSNCAGLENLPSDIGKLDQVEVLDISGTTQVYSLPDETAQLVLLRDMKLSFYGPDDESEFDQLPSQLVSPCVFTELKELRALSITVHPEDRRWTNIASRILDEVMKLEKLSYLQFYFPKVEIFEEYILMNQHILSKFNFIVGQSVKRIVSRVPDEVESLFDQQDRCLRFVNGDKVTQLIKTALIQVTAFYLDHHTEIQSLSEFGISNFKALKFCLVRECPKIQVIMDEKTGEGAFPCLEHLGVYYLWELKHIWKLPSTPGRLMRILRGTPAPTAHFKALKCLSVITCPKLQFILWESMLQSLSNLEELVVKDCEKVQKIIKEEKKKVKYEDVILPGLRKLELHYLPDLVSLGNGLRLSEEKVNVHGCPKLIL